MGILAQPMAAMPPRALQDELYNDYRPASAAGVSVTPETALTLPTVYACTTIISEDIGKVPLQMFEDLGDQGSRRASNLPLEELLHDQPNEYQTAIEFKEMLTAFSLLRSFGIAEIIPGPRGPVDQLIPLHPDLVRQDTTGTQRRYIYRDPKRNFQERTLLSDEVFVLRGKLSRSILDYARDSLGIELATERFQGQLFARGARFQGVVSATKPIAEPIRKGLRAALDEYAIGGSRAGRPLLLEDGMTWTNAAMSSKDAQLVDNLRWGALQTCRWFRMPPSKIADLTESHYNNVEQASIDYVVDTLLSWTVRWEQAIRRDLIVNKLRYFARLNLDALLRGDIAARSAAYALAIQWGWMSRDEVRGKENLNPMGGEASKLNFDTGHGQPVNKVSANTKGHLRLLASDAAARVVRREMSAIAKVAERAGTDAGGFRKGVEEFYSEHAGQVAATLHIPEHVARLYASEQRDALLAAGGIAPMDNWPTDRAAHLTSLAIDQEELAA